MFCTKCGAQFNGSFCPNCGAPASTQAQPQMNMPAGGSSVVVERRDIAVSIILSIVTLGIYALYWMYKLNDEVSAVSYEQNPTPGGRVILLTIVTLGIYSLYWNYKQGERIDRIHSMRGIPAGTSWSLLYLIIGIVGFTIINLALMQNELNTYA